MNPQNSLSGLLVQLGPIPVQDVVGVMVRGEVANIVDLSPATLLEPQRTTLTPNDGAQSLESKRSHDVMKRKLICTSG
jgi:hypothetical protein